MDLEIKVEFPEGNLCAETDIGEFKTHVAGQINEIAAYNNLTTRPMSESGPDGTLGVDQVFQFIVENFDNIPQLAKSTVIIVQSVNALAQLFIKKKSDSDQNSPSIWVKLGDEFIELPASNKEIEAFRKKIAEQSEESLKKSSHEGEE